MSAYLLYHRKTRPTGKKLAEALNIDAGAELRYRHGHSTLIRWGNAQFPDADAATPNLINSASAINLAGDKLRTLTKLREGDVRVPEFQTQLPNLGDGEWLGRRRRGFGGKDIVVLREGYPFRADDSEFFTRFLPNEREYRLHVVGGEVVRVQRKYLERPEIRVSEYVKNHKNGYVFKAPQRSLRKDRLDTAVRAVELLGLSFGAVDAIITPDDTMYVLEVNTAPACAPLTAQAYTDGFRRLLDAV